MSFLMGSKSKDKDKDPFTKKSQFYVEFLGWMECRGIRGKKFTDPVIRELRRRQQKMDSPPRLTIQVNKKELNITQDVEDKKKKGSIKKIKFPAIPARDVTYVRQATRSGDGRADDIVACIYLGYMPRTQRFVHVHVYRFDEATTAATFARQMSAMAENNIEHIRTVEIDLANKGEIEDPRLTSSDGLSEPYTTDSAVGSTSSGYSDDDQPPFSGSDEIDPDLQSLHEGIAFDNVCDELKFRMQLKDKPLLLPPKDYDTISRARGNLEHINERRCLNVNLVGDIMNSSKERNSSNESGVGLASPGSEAGNASDSVYVAQASPGMNRANGYVHRRENSFGQSSLNGSLNGSNRGSRQGSIHSGGRPASPTSPLDVYPPKTNSAPMSPKIGGVYPGPRVLGNLSRQNSGGSFHSHHSGDSNHSRNGVVVYKGGSVNDIYAVPNKGKFAAGRNSPRDIPPADYLEEDDEEIQMRGPGPRYRQPNMTRSMPAELIRSQMALGSRSPHMGGDPRYYNRHTVGGGPLEYGNAGMHSPRITSARR